MRIVWQTIRRVFTDILGMNGSGTLILSIRNSIKVLGNEIWHFCPLLNAKQPDINLSIAEEGTMFQLNFIPPLTGAQMEDVRGSWWRRDSSPSGEGGNKFSIFPLSGLFPLRFFHIFLEGQRQIQFYWSYLFSLLLECYLFGQTHKWDQNTEPGMILKLSQ